MEDPPRPSPPPIPGPRCRPPRLPLQETLAPAPHPRRWRLLLRRLPLRRVRYSPLPRSFRGLRPPPVHQPPVLSLNSHRLFDYEPLRKKEEGDDWEERFRGHTDTRPHDPQPITLDVSFFGSEFVTGIPEHATSLALSESSFSLYGSIPLMISHGKAGNNVGFFWLNAAEMQIYVLGKGWDSETGLLLPSEQDWVDTLWMAEAGIVDAFFFVGPGPKDVVRQYASVTGKPSMPPSFSTAYH
ncbi:hypothetical protein Tsubulata_023375 [Turnera subulata]|uniref:Glycoside hydrolase family 31 N-terminal domain-containing protein n=1 Tax=Turnera subulata TaxID=218843 RepID=A0A9Q0J5P8_9ROSI|nr:hypothetical protein Tsubulata_023375 [Turnera subulata]